MFDCVLTSTTWIADLFSPIMNSVEISSFSMFGVLIELFTVLHLELFGTKEEIGYQTKTQAKTQATDELFNPSYPS